MNESGSIAYDTDLSPVGLLDAPWLAPPSSRPVARGDTLRVLLITEASGGGSGRHVLDLSEGLLDRGHEVHLIYSPRRFDRFFRERLDRERDPDRPLRRDCRPMRRGLHPADLGALWSIRRYVRARGPFDVIHGHSAKGGALARLSGVGTGTPVLYTPHGYVAMDPGLSRRKRRFYQGLEWVLSKATDRLIAVSPEEERSCLGDGLGRSRVVLIPNGVAPIAQPPRSRTRRELGLADDWFVAGFVGRLVMQKAPDILIRAVAEVARETPRLRLVMVGSGPEEEALRALAGRLGVADRVLWLGERDGKTLFPAFDLFVLPSRKEGLPYVVLEAMSAAVPILATTTAGVEVLVQSGVNGLIVPPDQPVALAGALRSLVDDPQGLRRLGRNARQRAAQFTVEGMVDRTIDEYRSCLARRRPSQSLSTSTNQLPPWPSDDQAGDEDASSTQSRPGRNVLFTTNLHSRGESLMVSKPRSSELHPGPGFRVRVDMNRPDPALIESFREFATPDISDLLNRLYAMDPGIRCLTGSHHRLCGPACTVKVFPGDNLMVHKALDVAKPGDVVVVDASRSTQNAVLGDLISAKARHRGIAGFLVDGLVRDLPEIVPLDLPVFARGTTPIGPLHRGPGEINYPICCGGTVVNPGDLIVADAAGIIVVPREIAAELLERLERHKATNRAYFEAVRRGEFSNQWVDRLLEDHACPIIASDERRDGARAPHDAHRGHASSVVGLHDPAIDGAGNGTTLLPTSEVH